MEERSRKSIKVRSATFFRIRNWKFLCRQVVEEWCYFNWRGSASESKLNTYSDGFRVLRTIARLYKNYRPFGFFSTLAAVLGMISLCFLAPVLGEYFATGLVPRFPTLIVCACVLVAALLLFISGVILSSQLTKDDRDFEFHLQQVQQWKNRSADPFSHSAK